MIHIKTASYCIVSRKHDLVQLFQQSALVWVHVLQHSPLVQVHVLQHSPMIQVQILQQLLVIN